MLIREKNMKFDFDYFNFHEIFAINQEFVLSTEEIPKSNGKQVLIIDDFYQDVSKVRTIALNCPYTNLKEIIQDAPVFRTYLPKYDYINVILAQIFNKTYGIKLKSIDMFMFTLQTEEILNSTIRHSFAHTDTQNENQTFAGVLYLHDDTFGTSFYENKNPQISGVVDSYIIRYPSVFHETDLNQYNLLKTIPAKENRCIIYDGFMYHRPAYQDYSGKGDRLTQNFWFEHDTNIR